MKVIGLTGSIGMGKSTVAKLLGGYGFPIYSADAAVHAVLKRGGRAVVPVARLFPETLKRGGIDRALLGRAVFGDKEKLKKLEQIVHPLLAKAEREFLQKARKAKAKAAVLEIPLLFETGAQKRCDLTFCVVAPAVVQRARVLARPGMTAEKLRAILARQMPIAEKRRKADHSIPTGAGLESTAKYLDKLLTKLDLLP